MLQCFVAKTEHVVILGDGRRVEWRAVGKSDARADLERVFGRIRVDRPGFGDPRFDLKRLWVLIGQPVGDLIEDTAVRIEAACRGIEIGMGLLLQIDQRPAFYRLRAFGVGTHVGQARRRQRREGERNPFQFHRHESLPSKI
ncbi:hypothetical protein D9M70_523940 [compost metagenome]